MTDIVLQRASGVDIDRLTPLVEAYHAFEGLDLAPAARREALARLLDDPRLGACWFIRETADGADPLGQEPLGHDPLGHDPLGYVALCLGYSIEFAGVDAFVDELYLVPEARGRGVGARALALLEREAAALGVVALHLEVAQDNDRAQRLYERQGYAARRRYMLMSRRLTSL